MAPPIRILLADDHPVVRDGLAAILSTQPDFEVVGTAATGLEAVRLAAEVAPDVALLDLAMPEMDGWEFLAEQQAHPVLGQIPVLVMSGRQNLGRQALPAADVLPKPFILSRLLDRLEQLTRR